MDDQVDQILLRVRQDFLPDGDCEQTLNLLTMEAAAAMAAEGVDARRAFADAWEREQAEPTFIGQGMAVPHARAEGLQRACVYLAYSRSGIPWPQEPAQFIALLIVPWDSPELHLRLLAHLVRWRRHLAETAPCTTAESTALLTETLNSAFRGLL